MKITIEGSVCKVERETTDPKIYNESRLLHLIKTQLNHQGYDLIKKLMWKDGHMTSDHLHYLRVRNPRKIKSGEFYAIWHERFALEVSYEEFNAGSLYLKVEYSD